MKDFQKLKIALFGTILLTILFVPYLKSQEIKATVNINVEQLSLDQRQNVSSMESDLTRYINSQSFSDTKWEGEPIPIDINIVLKGGSRNRYSARILIGSRRLLDGPGKEPGQSVVLKIIDDRWQFYYGMGANLTFNPLRFDEFTSLIDFYMFLIMGYDLDTYKEIDGSPMFEKAKQILSLGSSAGADGYQTYSQPGELTRYNLVTDLTDMRYYDLRRLFLTYYVGLDQMEFDKDKATVLIENVINDMAKFKKEKMVGASALLQIFFDTKAQEISSIFKNYPNKAVFESLKYLDPGNSMLYDDASNGK